MSDEAADRAEAPETRIIVGYCDVCKKPIEQRDQYQVEHVGKGSTQRLFCQSCYLKRQKERRIAEYGEEQSAFRKGIIGGSVAAGCCAVASAVTSIAKQDAAFLSILILALLAFTFVAQCFWESFPLEVMAFFCKSFHLPGLIFTLDLDGIIWFITVKLTLSILFALLSVLLFCFGVCLALAISLFTFPFSLLHKLRELKRLRAAI